jgi:hypothetical protein
MKRYDITLICIGIVWLWVILGTAAVMKADYPILQILVLELDGAAACLLTLMLKRSTMIGSHKAMTTKPPVPPFA